MRKAGALCLEEQMQVGRTKQSKRWVDKITTDREYWDKKYNLEEVLPKGIEMIVYSSRS